MVGIGGWREGGFSAVLSLHATLSAAERYGITRTECTTTVTSIASTTWQPLALSSKARSLTPFSPPLRARTIAGDGIEGKGLVRAVRHVKILANHLVDKVRWILLRSSSTLHS
jgi:hypothetical protein